MSLPKHSVIISKEAIDRRIKELAAEIAVDMHDKNPLIVVVLKGAFVFASDLIKHFDFPFEVDFISISSYGDSTKSSGVVKLLKDLDEPIKDRTLLLLEDIIDTGLTLNYLYSLMQIRSPKRIEVAAFLNKIESRNFDVPIKYTGFEIENKFVVGYGLDFKQQYRGLPYVIAIEE
jgi:hypoxanthine phosphoribosyltransferase